ncbi:MAG TPA: DUF4240 domain-containing protein [Gemmataceae bacterium]|nr:DUF4240 domain-containing protein [Gemmataceae bacterium]
MDYPQFWHLVDATRGQPDRAEKLARLLEPCAAGDIVRFRLLYDDLMHAANTVDLWGAAHTINGGCSDDGFYYFREGLIELGRPVFEAAVKDPDSLADLTAPGERVHESEGLGNAPLMAWVAKTGGTEEAFYEAVDGADERTDRGDAETGEWWDFADHAEVRHRLPRLAAKHLAGVGE